MGKSSAGSDYGGAGSGSITTSAPEAGKGVYSASPVKYDSGTNRIAKYLSDSMPKSGKELYGLRESLDLQKLLYGKNAVEDRYERVASLEKIFEKDFEKRLQPVPGNKKCPTCGSLVGLYLTEASKN